MSRLMSVAFTEAQVRARIKTVTRRAGWWTDKHGRRLVVPGDTLTLVRKAMGRKPGEPLVRICDVEVLSVRREPLHFVQYAGELTAEGFSDLEQLGPDAGPEQFIAQYFTPQRLDGSSLVTRIEWRYLDGAQ